MCSFHKSLFHSLSSLFHSYFIIATPESDDIACSPSIPSTLAIHKLVRKIEHNGDPTIHFFDFPFKKYPMRVQTYSTSRRLNCGHIEKEYESLAQLKSICAFCSKLYVKKEEVEDWLNCSMCLQWFHESCFQI